jgi:predicted MFS family arabinose efflux permease
MWPCLYLAVPYLLLLPNHLQQAGIYFCLLTKITFQAICFPSNAILLINAAPSKSALGTINGLSSSIACLARALGPTVNGWINSAGLELGYGGLAWWAIGLACAIGALQSHWIEEPEESLDRPLKADEQITCGPLLHPAAIESTENSTSRLDNLPLMDELDLTKPLKQ